MTDIPKTMRGVILLGHGGPEMLEYRNNLPVPHPGKGEVLVRVAAAGVNNTDINTRIGWYSKTDGTGEGGSWTGEAIRFPRIRELTFAEPSWPLAKTWTANASVNAF